MIRTASFEIGAFPERPDALNALTMVSCTRSSASAGLRVMRTHRRRADPSMGSRRARSAPSTRRSGSRTAVSAWPDPSVGSMSVIVIDTVLLPRCRDELRQRCRTDEKRRRPLVANQGHCTDTGFSPSNPKDRGPQVFLRGPFDAAQPLGITGLATRLIPALAQIRDSGSYSCHRRAGQGRCRPRGFALSHDPRSESYGEEGWPRWPAPDWRPSRSSRRWSSRAVGAGGGGAAGAIKLSLKAAAAALGLPKVTIAERAGRRTLHRLRARRISPLGQRKRLPTVVDTSALGFDRVLCSAGERGWDVALAPADLVALTQAVTATFAP